MDLDAAMEKAHSDLTTSSTPEPVQGDSTPTEVSAPVETTQTAAPASGETTTTDRARSPDGKFVRKEPLIQGKPNSKGPVAPKGDQSVRAAAPTATPGEATEAETPSPATSVAAPASPAPAAIKVPQAWRSEAKAVWDKVPPEAMAEIDRIERETKRAMQDASQARQFATEVQASLRPYEPIARANGMDPMAWAGNALQTVAALYAGTPQQKASTIAQAIKMSGADLDAINAALQGQAPAQGPQQYAPQDIAALVREEAQRFAQQERERMESEHNREAAESFLANPPEHWPLVEQDAIELIRLDRMRAAQGVQGAGKMTPQDAYTRACRFNEEVQRIESGKKAAAQARTATAATQAAKAAAVSVRSQPGSPVRTPVKGIEGALEAAAAKLGYT